MKNAEVMTLDSIKKKSRVTKETRKQYIAAYIFLLPWLIGFLGLVLGPMISSLYLSFTRFDLLNPPEWIGLANYSEMFQDTRWIASAKVTMTFVFIAVPTQLIAALLVAVLLNKKWQPLDFIGLPIICLHY
ncbi:sugar ABC transporter [Gracilibacillus boraciitolerans JCM 21714]|uniref:Sugar ABC transporter n=1 Tax=Gracilibacillus boraciitolerans JCM 21714 TaxID=1298598 RepID=W4VJ80_9BACI|nr:sugar ABC transporter [Gracilibacillus boraciitolerans JCM 21714]